MIYRNIYAKAPNAGFVKSAIDAALNCRDLKVRYDERNEMFTFIGLRSTSPLASGGGNIAYSFTNERVHIRFGLSTSPTFLGQILFWLGLVVFVVGALFAWLAIQQADSLIVNELDSMVREIENSLRMNEN